MPDRARFETTTYGYLPSMSEEGEATVEQTDPESQTEGADNRGIETTTGEPNTFEPEEDPDATADAG